MSSGLDKNVLMVAVVGVVAVVGLFALLGDGTTTGLSVSGNSGYKACLAKFSDATNVVELCDCKYPLREDGRREIDGSCDVDAVYVAEEETLEAYAGRELEGARGEVATTRSKREFERDLREVAAKEGYVDAESWVRCKLGGGTVSDCDVYKYGLPDDNVVTGNFVNMHKICVSREGAKGTLNADLYCICRDRNQADCRDRFDKEGVDRVAWDSCVAEIGGYTGNTGFSTTDQMWTACRRFLPA